MDPPNYAGVPPTGAAPHQPPVPGMPPGMAVPPGYPMPATYLQQYAAAQAQGEQLRRFWAEMREEASRAGTDPLEFKTQQLPLARIKKIMKSDEDVRMISAEAPVLFAKACEYFILELTLRAWSAAEETKRRTLQRSDIATAIARTDVFDFLVDIVPREEANPPPANAPAPGAVPGAPGMAAPMSLYPPMMPGMVPPAPGGPGAGAAVPNSLPLPLPNGSVGPPGGLPAAPGNMALPPGGHMAAAMFGGGFPPGGAFQLPPGMYLPPQQQQQPPQQPPPPQQQPPPQSAPPQPGMQQQQQAQAAKPGGAAEGTGGVAGHPQGR